MTEENDVSGLFEYFIIRRDNAWRDTDLIPWQIHLTQPLLSWQSPENYEHCLSGL